MEIVIKFAFMLAGPLFIYISYDALFSWVSRCIVGTTLGFPTEYRVGDDDPRYDRSKPWASFHAEGIGGLTTPKIAYLATDDGMAFAMRSALGLPMTRTVCVPWSALRAEKVSDHITDRNRLKIVVLNPDGSVATTLVPQVLTDRRRLAAIGRLIARADAKESHAG
ncbi:hypothetical protein [Paludisphaera sp.]|uniref:hypothetical protein n=1 Tax=Paludisphaera sp. TaxID=2017432 RepID=UPI00301CB962